MKIKSKKQSLDVISAAYVEHSTLLKKFLTRYFSSHQDIEDIVQETYLKAYVEDRKKGVEQPKAFLFRVAKNVAFTQLNKKSRRITDFLEDVDSWEVLTKEPSTDKLLEAEDSLKLYCRALAELSPKCRQVFLLRKVHGLPHSEIAKSMSLTVSSVEKYISRGIVAVRSYIREQEGCSANSTMNKRSP